MNSPEKNIIVGTAGHIDHGKSTLVEALTGTHPDRLEEEKRRGITIDLGFAFLEEQGVRFGFVDVPGHERFVKNMLAGATGIDLLLLVIAADEGVRPQTREHFDICRMLGVQRGVVVLTKSDAVDADTLGLRKLEVEEYLQRSFLDGAPILGVSAKTGAGLEELRKALREEGGKVETRSVERVLRLPIDRSFAVKGFGTVVTGTLISGQVAVGDEVELLPAATRARVRGLQTGGRVVERAGPGQRTAVNLAGVEHGAIERGMVLANPGKLRATRRLDARVELLASSPKLKQRAKVHVHIGTTETTGEITFSERKELMPGENALAQIRLMSPVVCVKGDRFILRQFSPVITIGGGTVLDPLARRAMKKDTGRSAYLAAMETGGAQEIVQAMTERSALGVTLAEIGARTAWLEGDVRKAALALVEGKAVQIVSNDPLILVAGAVFEEICEKLRTKVEAFHKENPLVAGMPREELRTSLRPRVRPEAFRKALDTLMQDKKLAVQGELVKRPGAEVTLTPEEARAKEQIEKAFANAGLAVPAVKEVLSQLAIESRRAEKIVQLLLRDKVLVRVSPELVFHSSALGKLPELLQAYKKAKGERIGVPSFKEITGITRKYAIPLLEYLDRQRMTRRVGDERVIL